MNAKDSKNQLKQWEESAKSGDAKASLLLANHYHDIGDTEAAFGWYVHTSKQKDMNPLAFFYLGYAYQYGEGTPIDMTEAFSMYKKAAACDVPQALYSLAYFYQNGIVVPRDEISAISYMKQATQKMDTLFLTQYDSNAEIERLRADVSLQKENVASLLQKNESLWRENGQLSEQITQAKNKIAESEKSREEVKRQSELAEQKASLQIKELSEQYDQKILEMKGQIVEFQNQISLLMEQNERLHTQLQEQSAHETELWKEIDERDKMVQRHMQKIDECKSLVSTTNLRYTKCSSALENSKAEVEQLTRAVLRLTYWIDENMGVEFASQSLSGFSKFSFTVDGVKCMSLESFLQSLKFKNITQQQAICCMPPEQARKLGKRKIWWKRTGNLWWKGSKIKRSSLGYQMLLNRVFDELIKNKDFTRVLMNCGNIEIIRTANTAGLQSVIMSEDEFISRVVNMRHLLQGKDCDTKDQL